MAQVFVFGCVTADLQLKQSQKQTPYVCFDLAEHIGYGDGQRTIYYQVWAWREDALRLIRLKVKKGSMIWITGSLELVDCTSQNGNVKTKRLKISLDNCGYMPSWQQKQQDGELTGGHGTEAGFHDPSPPKVLDGEREPLPE